MSNPRTTASASANAAIDMWYDVWHCEDSEAVSRWWEPEGYAHIETAYPAPFPGNREQATHQIAWMLSAFTGWWDCDIYAADDDRVVINWVFDGSHTGTWRGLPATHCQVFFKGVDLIRIRNGRVTEFSRLIDEELELLAELGCVIDPVGFQDGAVGGMATTTNSATDTVPSEDV